MTSPLTGGTLTAQRANDRWKKYHLAIGVPNVVFSARINQTFATLDNVSQLTYDSGSGSYTAVLPGMTCYIGTGAGLSDIGIVRVRKVLTATIAPIPPTSGVQFADNQYLTFVDDFGIWAKPAIKSDTAELVDFDIEFSAQAFAPIIRIGPAAVVLELTGATVTYSPPFGFYSPNSATISTYAWTGTGTSATSGLTTNAPTFTYNAVGEHYITCTVTDSNGAITTASRKVFVRAATDAAIGNLQISGDVDSGGFECQIEGYTGVAQSALRDRALCVIWRQDYAGTARATSYGPYAGCTAVRFVGWLDGESLTIDPVTGAASFTIKGPAAWLDKISGSPMYRQSGVPTAWHHMASMTTDAALYSLIKWQSTLADITDVTLTGDTTPIYTANANSDSLRAQIDTLASEKLNARLCFDEYACAFVTIPPSLRTSTVKSANTVLFDLSSADLVEQIDIERVTSQSSGQIEIGGASYDGATEALLYSRAPGNAFNHYGSIDAPTTTLAFASQTACNQLAGDMLADANREYPSTQVKLYWANDFAGYAMAQGWLCRMSLASGDTPRGLTWTNKRLEIQSVGFEFDAETGAEGTALEIAEETTGAVGVTYHPPVAEDDNQNFSPPSAPPFPGIPPISTWFPPGVFPPPPPNPGGGCPTDAPGNAFAIAFSPGNVSGLDPSTSSFCYFPCTLRPASYTNGQSYIVIDAMVWGDLRPHPETKLTCYAIDSGKNRILTASSITSIADRYLTILFSPASPLAVAGFEIVLAPSTADPSSDGTMPLTLNHTSVDTLLINSGTGSITFTGHQVAFNLVRCDFVVDTTDTSNLLYNTLQGLCYMDVTGVTNVYAQIVRTHMGGSSEMYCSFLLSLDTTYRNTDTAVILVKTWPVGVPTTLDVTIGVSDLPASLVGTYHLGGSVYYSTGSITPAEQRRISYDYCVVFNVCP